MAKNQLCLGVDIGSTSVKICGINQTRQGFVLDHFSSVDLPPDNFVDGVIMNSSSIVDTIQEVIASYEMKRKDVALSISGHSIIKHVSLPKVDHKSFQENLQWEAEQFIPFNIDEVFLDAFIVGDSEQPGQMDVILVAAKKDFVHDYTSVIIEAGLNPVICDLDVFAIETMFEQMYPEEANDEVVVLLDIGASSSRLNILSNKVSRLTRDIVFGGDHFTKDICKKLNILQNEGEILKIKTNQSEFTTLLPEEVRSSLSSIADNFVDEIQRSIDFYCTMHPDSMPQKIYLMGGGSQIKFISQSLENKMTLPAVFADPFRNINTSEHDINYIKKKSLSASVVVGLALRYHGDSY